MAMGKDQAVTHIKKVVHTLKVFENALEALEVARTASANLVNMNEEGKKLEDELREMKNIRRNAEKDVENWRRKAQKAEEDFNIMRAELQRKFDEEVEARKNEGKEERKKLNELLNRLRKEHVDKVKKMEQERSKLEGEFNDLRLAMSNLTSQVEKFEGLG